MLKHPTIVIVKNSLPEIAKQIPNKVDQAIRKGAFDVEAAAKVAAPVDTGTLRASIHTSMVKLMWWRVSVGAAYGIYVEYGTAKSPAQPFMTPSFEKLRNSIVRSIAGAVKQIGGVS